MNAIDAPGKAWRQPRQRIFNAPASVLILIGILLAVHLARQLSGEDAALWSLGTFAFIPAQLTGGWKPSLPGARVWSFLSYALIHGDWLHAGFNSVWMLAFGSVLARRLGAWRFYLHAAVSAAAGALASLAFHWGEQIFVIGASGAVSGQMAAAVPLMYGSRLPLGRSFQADLSRAVPLTVLELLSNRRALLFIAIWLAITLLTGAGAIDPGGNPAIAWEAHVGGFLGGLAAFYLIDRTSSQR